jgi:hypothetical protein
MEPMMKKWEYRILSSHEDRIEAVHSGPVEDYLNVLGDDGWEVIKFDFKISAEGYYEFSGVAKKEYCD